MTDRFDAYIERLRSIIAEHGHAVQGVMPGERSYGFAYTVGLSPLGQRELLVIGLPMDTAHHVLNAVAERLKDQAELPEELVGIVNVPLRLREVAVATLCEPLGVYGVAGVPLPETVVQVVWPCAAGHWPGTAGYSAACPQDPTKLNSGPLH